MCIAVNVKSWVWRIYERYWRRTSESDGAEQRSKPLRVVLDFIKHPLTALSRDAKTYLSTLCKFYAIGFGVTQATCSTNSMIGPDL